MASLEPERSPLKKQRGKRRIDDNDEESNGG